MSPSVEIKRNHRKKHLVISRNLNGSFEKVSVLLLDRMKWCMTMTTKALLHHQRLSRHQDKMKGFIACQTFIRSEENSSLNDSYFNYFKLKISLGILRDKASIGTSKRNRREGSTLTASSITSLTSESAVDWELFVPLR